MRTIEAFREEIRYQGPPETPPTIEEAREFARIEAAHEAHGRIELGVFTDRTAAERSAMSFANAFFVNEAAVRAAFFEVFIATMMTIMPPTNVQRSRRWTSVMIAGH